MSTTAMHVLVVQNGKYQGKRLKLAGREIIVGRDEKSGIRIGSAEVSRQHCVLTVRNGGVFVRDLGSRNGTLVDDVPIRGEVPLQPGSVLTVGPMSFRLVSRVRPADGTGAPDGSLSDDEIATWLTEHDTTTGLSNEDTAIITGRDLAPSPPPIQPPKKKPEFRTIADEAADIIRRHQASLAGGDASDTVS